MMLALGPREVCHRQPGRVLLLEGIYIMTRLHVKFNPRAIQDAESVTTPAATMLLRDLFAMNREHPLLPDCVVMDSEEGQGGAPNPLCNPDKFIKIKVIEGRQFGIVRLFLA